MLSLRAVEGPLSLFGLHELSPDPDVFPFKHQALFLALDLLPSAVIAGRIVLDPSSRSGKRRRMYLSLWLLLDWYADVVRIGRSDLERLC